MGVSEGSAVDVTVGGTGVGGGTVEEALGAAVQPAINPASRVALISIFKLCQDRRKCFVMTRFSSTSRPLFAATK
jgi:hypothetical protein